MDELIHKLGSMVENSKGPEILCSIKSIQGMLAASGWGRGKGALTRLSVGSISFGFAGCWFLRFLSVVLGVQIKNRKHVGEFTHFSRISLESR